MSARTGGGRAAAEDTASLLGSGSAAAPEPEAALRSPHGKAMKCLFGWAMASPWCAVIGLGVCGDIFALKYHADVGVLGTIKLLVGVLSLLFDVAIGYLQDKERWVFASCCFSKERWGRRAPWLLVHCPIMAVFMYLSWAPLSVTSTTFLAWWYALVMIGGHWCWQMIFTAAQAGCVECYPFKEERVVVEGFNVMWSAFGVSVAVCLVAVAYQFPLEERPGLRNLLGLVCGGVGLVSLPAALALRDARQPADAARISFISSIREVAAGRAWRIYAIAAVLDGCAGSVQAGFFLYYYTFVARLTDAQIAVWIAAVPILGLAIQSLMAGFWGRWFSSKHRTPRLYTAAGRLIDAAFSFALFANSTSIEGFLLGYCVNRVLLSPRSFWSISARGWIIDEDSQVVEGRRRESLFTGVSAAIAKVSSPVAAGFLAAQAAAGIDTTQDREYEQPAAGLFYIRSMYMILLPCLNVLQAVAILSFPIKGERLRALEVAQAKTFRPVARHRK